MHEFDDAVLKCFLDNQSQLFPEEDVASTMEEAESFLEECFAVVVNSVDEVWDSIWKAWKETKFWMPMKYLMWATADI